MRLSPATAQGAGPRQISEKSIMAEIPTPERVALVRRRYPEAP
jgi:hypothetical protein